MFDLSSKNFVGKRCITFEKLSRISIKKISIFEEIKRHQYDVGSSGLDEKRSKRMENNFWLGANQQKAHLYIKLLLLNLSNLR